MFPLLSLALAWCIPVTADHPPFRNSDEYNNGKYGNYPRQRYLSNPHVIGPVANIYTQAAKGLSPSKYMAWAPYGPDMPQTPPVLLDANTGSMVWYGPQHDWVSIGTNIQRCNGTDYVTWWQGHAVNDRMVGRHYLYNSRYEQAFNVTAVGNIEFADSHELTLTAGCTAIVSAYQTRPYDLTSIGKSHLKDSYFQEIDLATGELLFEWQASRFVDMNETLWTGTVEEDMQWKKIGLDFIDQGKKQTDGFDYFHINSIEKDGQGNYLISARHTCTIYYIDGASGEILWRLGGTRSDFRDLSDGKASDFAWQHHARWVDEELTMISLYDNRNSGYKSQADPVSRGMIVKLDYTLKTVTLDKAYTATHGVTSYREGSTQVLKDSPIPGNVLLGYGHEPAWTEYAPDGRVLLDVALGPFGRNRHTADSYRAFKADWTGTPTWGPSLVSGPAFNYTFNPTHETFHIRLTDAESGVRLPNDTLYVSWNGATQVSSWVLLVCNLPTPDFELARDFHAEVATSSASFEDHSFVGTGAGYAAALAVDAADEVIGVSNLVFVETGSSIRIQSDLARLTRDLHAYRAEKTRAGSILGALHDTYESVRVDKLHASPAVAAAGLSGLSLLALLCVVSGAACLCCGNTGRCARRSKARWSRLAGEEPVSIGLVGARYEDGEGIWGDGHSEDSSDDEQEKRL